MAKETVKVEISGIKWDTDGEDPRKLGLPKSVSTEVENGTDEKVEDEISEWLSNTYGYCHKGFTFERGFKIGDKVLARGDETGGRFVKGEVTCDKGRGFYGVTYGGKGKTPKREGSFSKFQMCYA